uniref:Uncharacterized protein n=1 Tax=virus sp. ctkyY8 TaxID=2827995 RepID=A0A8S5RDM6_9VIRU|nr:MAG TPA: hypothetical protein [virus sp. ctkyY8]
MREFLYFSEIYELFKVSLHQCVDIIAGNHILLCFMVIKVVVVFIDEVGWVIHKNKN